jgi:hypothetical protein
MALPANQSEVQKNCAITINGKIWRFILFMLGVSNTFIKGNKNSNNRNSQLII